MPKALPEHVLPLRLARQGDTLEGSVSLERMPRLATLTCENAGDTSEGGADGGAGSARFTLRFGYDDAGQARVLGRIEAQPVMLCQRCLEPMRVDLVCDVSLALVAQDTDVSTLDPGYEPLVVGESPQRLSDLIEDEIILALPNFARHQRGTCRMPAGADAADDDSAPQESRRENPFAVLKHLKSRKSS